MSAHMTDRPVGDGRRARDRRAKIIGFIVPGTGLLAIRIGTFDRSTCDRPSQVDTVIRRPELPNASTHFSH